MTFADTEPSFARAVSSVFERAYVQSAACVTVNVRPAMVRLQSVPRRCWR